MHIPWLTRKLSFPHPDTADKDGVVAVGGDLSVERILLAYNTGIFPWPMSHEDPVFWFSPNPRWAIEPKKAHLPRSLRKEMRRETFEIRVDTDFAGVIFQCAEVNRPTQDSTWITLDMEAAYTKLHEEGWAHSVEAWRDNKLVGGLYGISIGGAFFGESMFASEPDASKVAFATLLGHLVKWEFDFVDCQTKTEHLQRFGAVAWPRKQFLERLATTRTKPTRKGPWRFEMTPGQAEKLIEE
jgi:leucyl/phenylalanyl-tRNA---protein transferase